MLPGKLWFTLSGNFLGIEYFDLWDLGIVATPYCAHVIREYLHSLLEFTLSDVLLSHVRGRTFEKSGCRICAFRKSGSTLSEIFLLNSNVRVIASSAPDRTGTHVSTNSLSLHNKSYVGYTYFYMLSVLSYIINNVQIMRTCSVLSISLWAQIGLKWAMRWNPSHEWQLFFSILLLWPCFMAGPKVPKFSLNRLKYDSA